MGLWGQPIFKSIIIGTPIVVLILAGIMGYTAENVSWDCFSPRCVKHGLTHIFLFPIQVLGAGIAAALFYATIYRSSQMQQQINIATKSILSQESKEHRDNFRRIMESAERLMLSRRHKDIVGFVSIEKLYSDTFPNMTFESVDTTVSRETYDEVNGLFRLLNASITRFERVARNHDPRAASEKNTEEMDLLCLVVFWRIYQLMNVGVFITKVDDEDEITIHEIDFDHSLQIDGLSLHSVAPIFGVKFYSDIHKWLLAVGDLWQEYEHSSIEKPYRSNDYAELMDYFNVARASLVGGRMERLIQANDLGF